MRSGFVILLLLTGGNQITMADVVPASAAYNRADLVGVWKVNIEAMKAEMANESRFKSMPEATKKVALEQGMKAMSAMTIEITKDGKMRMSRGGEVTQTATYSVSRVDGNIVSLETIMDGKTDTVEATVGGAELTIKGPSGPAIILERSLDSASVAGALLMQPKPNRESEIVGIWKIDAAAMQAEMTNDKRFKDLPEEAKKKALEQGVKMMASMTAEITKDGKITMNMGKDMKQAGTYKVLSTEGNVVTIEATMDGKTDKIAITVDGGKIKLKGPKGPEMVFMK